MLPNGLVYSQGVKANSLLNLVQTAFWNQKLLGGQPPWWAWAGIKEERLLGHRYVVHLNGSGVRWGLYHSRLTGRSLG
ncbi:MAG: hypothetical protein JWO49_1188 [Arthrobacter sp.]|nr:hypothetical protein [Arthrobacter sp.]